MKWLKIAGIVGALCMGAGAIRAEEKAEPAAAQGLVELKTELPQAMFEGTPVPFRVPHLDETSLEKRPPFMVPQGVTNLSLNKPVTSSDDFPLIGELEYVTDGDKSGVEGSYVELFSGQQWVQIDLQQPSEIYAIILWFFHRSPRVYHDVIVRVSDDPDFIEGVKTLFNNDHDNSSGMGVGRDKAFVETNQGRLIDAKGVTARYVRVYTNGNTANDMNHFCEVEVHGRPSS
jgi:hypothetical protein